jgi:hypothetical protein
MTDFDYGLAKNAIRITSDRSECVWLWFWPQMTPIRDRMIAAAKQDMWEARRESREHVFCGERRGKQCDLTIDQLRTWKGMVRVQFGLPETAAAVLAWARESGIVLVDDREKPSVSSPVSSKAARDRQDRERSAVLRREAAVPPSPVMPLASRFRPRHLGNRSPRPAAPCYRRCHCRRTYSGKRNSCGDWCDWTAMML